MSDVCLHTSTGAASVSTGSQPIRNFGRYEIISELGRGAMGVVYKARDPQIDRLVALKTIALSGQSPEEEEEFRKRFLYEAQAAGRLHHAGIVTIFDLGESPEDHNPYIVLEFVAGETLNRILARQKKMPIASALQLAEELAEALDYAHGQGVVHRDIKPANILVTEDGHAKIADFGIAKLNLSHFTLPGKVLGTPAYMAPEQLAGEGVDGRSDIFSLGVILYAMVTGHSPFHGDSATTVCFKVVNRDPMPPSAFDLDLPSALDALIFRAMAKNPADRYQNGAALANDLRELRQNYKPGTTSTSFGPLSRATSGSFRVASTSSARSTVVREKNLARGAGLLDKPIRDIILGAALTIAALIVGIPLRRVLTSHPSSETQVRSTAGEAVPLARTVPPAAGTPVKEVKPQSTPVTKSSNTTSRSTKPVIVPTATLDLAVQHQFKEATLSIWIDSKLALTRPLRGGTQKHLVVFNGVRGVNSESIQVPAGAHTLRLRAQTTDNTVDISKTVYADFVGGEVKNLQVTFDRHNTIMNVNWR